MKAAMLEQQSQELTENISVLSNQINQLQKLNLNLGALKTPGQDLLSPLGSGVYLKTSLRDENVLVNVGAGILIKKSPMEAKSMIENQIKSMHEAKLQLTGQLEIYNHVLGQAMEEIRSAESNKD